MITRGVYSATCSILNDDHSLNVDATIAHAAETINNGLHGVIFFGSTGQSQLISISEKKDLIAKISIHKLRKHFFLGTGCNSLNETVDLIKYGFEYDFKDFLIMPPAYYKGNTAEGVFNFYSHIISKVPKIKIILYNFELLSGYKFSVEAVTKLVKAFPNNIIGCKDSTSNLYENFLMPVDISANARIRGNLKVDGDLAVDGVTNLNNRTIAQDISCVRLQIDPNSTSNEGLIIENSGSGGGPQITLQCESTSNLGNKRHFKIYFGRIS